MKGSEFVKFAVITANTDDSTDIQFMQVKVDEVARHVASLYPYGLFSNAPLGSLVVALNIKGHEENKVGIPMRASEDRFKDLEPGETVFGNVISRSHIKILNNGDIEVTSLGNIVATATGNIEATADGDIEATAGGDITITASGKVDITATSTVTVNAPQVDLGGSGGFPVAQIGVSQVVIPSGSSAGTFPVTLGSAIVKAT